MYGNDNDDDGARSLGMDERVASFKPHGQSARIPGNIFQEEQNAASRYGAIRYGGHPPARDRLKAQWMIRT